MQNRTALIVDDSRTASQMLRLMLEREEFQVDVLDSAEAALGYLRDHRPGIIFMDHLMPGMDGFEAVKEIKNSSVTSAIPIVMYTAKSGDLYVGQAHALGAVDILPKPPTRESLRAIFRRIDERTEAANEPEPTPTATPETTPAPSAPSSDDWDIAGSDRLPEPTPAPERAVPAPERAPSQRTVMELAAGESTRVAWWIALAASAAAFVLGMQFPGFGTDNARYLPTVSWAISEGLSYPYGEAPFAGPRLERVRALIQHLAADGFKGTVKLQGHSGSFCLVADSGGWRVPEPGMSIEACDSIGPSGQEARQASGMLSPEFRAFLNNSPLLAGSGIGVFIEAMGDSAPLYAYPSQDEMSSVGDWNRIAAENNRIQVVLIPEQK